LPVRRTGWKLVPLKAAGTEVPRPPVGDDDFVTESPRFTPTYEKIGDFAVKNGETPDCRGQRSPVD
jgi:hypothetical protein